MPIRRHESVGLPDLEQRVLERRAHLKRRRRVVSELDDRDACGPWAHEAARLADPPRPWHRSRTANRRALSVLGKLHAGTLTGDDRRLRRRATPGRHERRRADRLVGGQEAPEIGDEAELSQIYEVSVTDVCCGGRSAAPGV